MKDRRRGFTLIELAIVLVVLGVLAGIGAGIVGLLIKRVHYNQNRERLEANVEALLGYALTNNGRLPDSANCSQYLRNAKDVWGKDFVCITALELTKSSACARKTTSLQVIDDNDNATHENIAFVIISGGPNYNVQTSGSSTTHIYIPGYPNVDDYTTDMDRPEPYDDMVRYVSLAELKAKLKCPYSEEYLRILNNELPYGFEGSSYNATVYAAGGVPYTSGGKYRWCVEDPSNLQGAGIDFICGTGSATISANCSSEPTWNQCDQIEISGNASATGTFSLTFFVKDADNNTTQKTLALTINSSGSPGGGGGGGTCAYGTPIIVNNVGGTRYVEVGSKFGFLCVSSGSCIEFTSISIGFNQCATVYRKSNCRGRETKFSYDDAYSADISRDCVVSYNNGVLSD
ncbi:type II secretion system protein [Thermosulfurimonas dismutans]|nr:type II secretion system protein [Thermosulfurimonas dismutans]